MRQKELAAALKGIVILCLAAVLLLFGFLVPWLGWQAVAGTSSASLFTACIIGLWISCVPVLAVLVLVWRMASQIGRDNSFCLQNVRSLTWICWLSVADTAYVLVGSVVLALLRGGMELWLLASLFLVLCLGIAVAVVSAVLSHLVQRGTDLKTDHDLTI